jgi:hypothetical protein
MAGHHFTSKVLSERSESKDQPSLLIACEGELIAGPNIRDYAWQAKCSHSFLSASWRNRALTHHSNRAFRRPPARYSGSPRSSTGLSLLRVRHRQRSSAAQLSPEQWEATEPRWRPIPDTLSARLHAASTRSLNCIRLAHPPGGLHEPLLDHADESETMARILRASAR